MRLRKYQVFLGLFLLNIYSAFAASVQDAFTNLAEVFSDFDIYEIYQIAPRFVDFVVVLVILLRVMKLPPIVKALGGESMGKKTGTVIAIVMSFAIFTLPAQYGISTLAIGVLGLLLLAIFITLAASSFIYGWFWNKGWTGKAFCITFSFLLFGATMNIFGGGDLNGLEEVSPLLSNFVEFIYSLGLLSLIFVWPAIFGRGASDGEESSAWNSMFGPNNPIRNLFGGNREDDDSTGNRQPVTHPTNPDGTPDFSQSIRNLERRVNVYERQVRNRDTRHLDRIESRIMDQLYDIVGNTDDLNRISAVQYGNISRIMLAFAQAKNDAVLHLGVAP